MFTSTDYLFSLLNQQTMCLLCFNQQTICLLCLNQQTIYLLYSSTDYMFAMFNSTVYMFAILNQQTLKRQPDWLYSSGYLHRVAPAQNSVSTSIIRWQDTEVNRIMLISQWCSYCQWTRSDTLYHLLLSVLL